MNGNNRRRKTNSTTNTQFPIALDFSFLFQSSKLSYVISPRIQTFAFSKSNNFHCRVITAFSLFCIRTIFFFFQPLFISLRVPNHLSRIFPLNKKFSFGKSTRQIYHANECLFIILVTSGLVNHLINLNKFSLSPLVALSKITYHDKSSSSR